MHEFERHYNDLVDLLCGSAKEGVDDYSRARYGELRGWLISHYEALRATLLRHLDTDTESAAATCDAFESLFLPTDIEEVINSEGVIMRIIQTRRALNACLNSSELITV
jgi:hypothetical protein